MTLFLVCLTVFVGSATQRLSGMGFALISSPFLVLLMGPHSGVVLVGLCGILTSVIVMARTFRQVEWKHSILLGVSAVVGTIPGAFLAAAMQQSLLEIFIGVVIVASLAVSLLLSLYAPPLPRNSANSLVTGLLSGAMATSAGVGGPPLSAYAVLSRWDQWAFGATIQPVFVFSSTAAVLVKVTVTPQAVPILSVGEVVAIIATLGVGQVVGELLAKVVPVSIARRMMLTLAFAGGLLTMGRGLVSALA